MATSNNRKSPASTTLPADRDILVCIFQRGAADGLNSLVPYGDPDYITPARWHCRANTGQSWWRNRS